MCVGVAREPAQVTRRSLRLPALTQINPLQLWPRPCGVFRRKHEDNGHKLVSISALTHSLTLFIWRLLVNQQIQKTQFFSWKNFIPHIYRVSQSMNWSGLTKSDHHIQNILAPLKHICAVFWVTANLVTSLCLMRTHFIIEAGIWNDIRLRAMRPQQRENSSKAALSLCFMWSCYIFANLMFGSKGAMAAMTLYYISLSTRPLIGQPGGRTWPGEPGHSAVTPGCQTEFLARDYTWLPESHSQQNSCHIIYNSSLMFPTTSWSERLSPPLAALWPESPGCRCWQLLQPGRGRGRALLRTGEPQLLSGGGEMGGGERML